MRRIAKATGASIVTTLADMEGNETFDPEVLGEAEEVSGATNYAICHWRTATAVATTVATTAKQINNVLTT